MTTTTLRTLLTRVHPMRLFKSYYHVTHQSRRRVMPSVLLSVGLGLTLHWKQTQINCLEDAILQRAKNTIEGQIINMKREFGTQMASYPTVMYVFKWCMHILSYSLRGPKYQIEFLIDQRKCDIFTVLVSALNVLERGSDSSDFKVGKVDTMRNGNIYTLQLSFTESNGSVKSHLTSKGSISISGEMSDDRPNFKLVLEKFDEITDVDCKAFVECYKEANRPRSQNFSKPMNKSTAMVSGTQPTPTAALSEVDAVKKLEELGVMVFLPEDRVQTMDWNYLAGYERQKRDIEDTVLLALNYPEIYDRITEATRVKNEPNRPKAVLFEGPPGTGKTTSAKIIAQQVRIPLIYMPIESIMSKYYGESEKRFADLWDACIKLGKCIIFIDEIDALAQQRNSEMHEASRRILSTLLRKIDSFESTTNVLLICATNRKQDLDPAMLSRLDLSVKFELPDAQSRGAIYQRYAKQLSDEDRTALATLSLGMSGRNIADVCKDAERRWAAKIIRKEVEQPLPDLRQYMETLNARMNNELS